MTQQINPKTVIALRSMKKTAIIVLLLFSLAGPVTAKRVADLLDIDYQTVRKYLRELSTLNVVSETPVGWVLLQGGPQLILPTNAIFDPEREKTAPGNAKKSRSDSTSPASTPDSFLSEEEEEEEEDKNSDETRKNRAEGCLAALAEWGIGPCDQVLELIQDETVTAEYITGQAERLKKENKFSTGMLLRVIRDHDPLPLTRSQRQAKTDYQYYQPGPSSPHITMSSSPVGAHGMRPDHPDPDIDPALQVLIFGGRTSPAQAWQYAKNQLKCEMPKAAFDAWVRDTRIADYQNGQFNLSTPSEYARDWMISRLTSTVTRLLTGICNQTVRVQFTTRLENDEQVC